MKFDTKKIAEFDNIKQNTEHNILDHRTRKMTSLNKKEWWFCVFNYDSISKPLDFEQWFAKNEDEIYCELGENGASRELDFNPELEFERRYYDYLDKF